jgi:hypothetical protein
MAHDHYDPDQVAARRSFANFGAQSAASSYCVHRIGKNAGRQFIRWGALSAFASAPIERRKAESKAATEIIVIRLWSFKHSEFVSPERPDDQGCVSRASWRRSCRKQADHIRNRGPGQISGRMGHRLRIDRARQNGNQQTGDFHKPYDHKPKSTRQSTNELFSRGLMEPVNGCWFRVYFSGNKSC